MRFGSQAEPDGIDPLPFRTNFLLGSDPASWRTGVVSFGGVRYREVYRGIDLVYHAGGGDLEFDFLVSPGADYSKIRIRFDDVQQPVGIAANGDLVIPMESGELRHRSPVIYEDVASGGRLSQDDSFCEGRGRWGSRLDLTIASTRW
jgi:hypothetical protein